MVLDLNSEKKKSDEYWMGVRDALRMVDSFVKWSSRYKEDAKTLEDFIHDGLIAAAKRCESCLSDQLGVRFDRKKGDQEYADQEDEELEDEHPGSDFESSHFSEEADYEQEFEEGYLTKEEYDEPSVEESPSGMVDSITGTAASMSEESLMEGEARDFEEDFEVPESMPYELDETEPAESSSEEPVDSADRIAEAPPESDDISHEEMDSEGLEDLEMSDSEEHDIPSFTWSDYESEMDEEAEDEETDEESVSPPKSWSPMDEPPVEEELEDDEDLEDDDTDESSNEEEENKKETPPPPPPPPETDDSEEERKRRARRLFFGT